jgi:hypothetical protein
MFVLQPWEKKMNYGEQVGVRVVVWAADEGVNTVGSRPNGEASHLVSMH